MAQTSGFVPENRVRDCFDCKIFDVTNWVAYLNREDGPGGPPSHESFSVAPQVKLEISSITGHPPYLVRDHIGSPGLMAKSCQCAEELQP